MTNFNLKRTLGLSTLLLFLALTLGTSTAMATAPYADWWAEYYSNPHLYGQPVAAVPEVEIDNDWGFRSPRQGMPADYFSVRWSANIEFEGGDYTFQATVDDGVRLWIDGVLLIDQWHVQSVTTHVARVALSSGVHHVQMAYYEETGEATARLTWRMDPRPQQQEGVVPLPQPTPTPSHYTPPSHPAPPASSTEIIVDNTSSGFLWGGPVEYRNTVHSGYNNSYYWTYNTSTSPINFGRWMPHLPSAGDYEVYVYVPHDYATTTNLRYRILHNGSRHDVLLNQGHYSNQWVSLGTYYFNAKNTGHEFVLAYDNTREAFTSSMIAFDAVKFVHR